MSADHNVRSEGAGRRRSKSIRFARAMADFQDHDSIVCVSIPNEIRRDDRQFAAPSADGPPPIR
jgi:hypothetical protein